MMDLFDILSTALQACGQTPLTAPSDYTLIDEGAWHHCLSGEPGRSFCYKFLLPAYNPVPRYDRHQLKEL